MASIVAFMVGAGMTGGFAYGIHKLRKDKKTDTTTYKLLIAGLVIGIVILVMAMLLGGRAAKEAVQMKGGLGGVNAANQPQLALPNQLRANAQATRAKIVADEGHLALLENAIKSATEAVEAQKRVKAN
jgi:hypothetical protein